MDGQFQQYFLVRVLQILNTCFLLVLLFRKTMYIFLVANTQGWYKMLAFKSVLVGEIENVLLNLNKRNSKIEKNELFRLS